MLVEERLPQPTELADNVGNILICNLFALEWVALVKDGFPTALYFFDLHFLMAGNNGAYMKQILGQCWSLGSKITRKF
jgi:hypothetical protein